MRYDDCTHPAGNCAVCSLSSYNRDCRNAPVNHIAYLRTRAGLTQQQTATATGINIRRLQKYESGECDIPNMSLRVAVSLAGVFGVTAEELLPEEA